MYLSLFLSLSVNAWALHLGCFCECLMRNGWWKQNHMKQRCKQLCTEKCNSAPLFMGINATTHPCVWESMWFNCWTIIRPCVAYHLGTPRLTPNAKARTIEQTTHMSFRAQTQRPMQTPVALMPFVFPTNWLWVSRLCFIITSNGDSTFTHLQGWGSPQYLIQASEWETTCFFFFVAHQQPGKLKLCCDLAWNKKWSYVKNTN